VPQGDTGDGYARLRAFPSDLSFEGFGVGVSLAHGNPDVKGNCVHLKIVDVFALIALDLQVCRRLRQPFTLIWCHVIFVLVR